MENRRNMEKSSKIKYEDLTEDQKQAFMTAHLLDKFAYGDNYQPEIIPPEKAKKDPDYEDE